MSISSHQSFSSSDISQPGNIKKYRHQKPHKPPPPNNSAFRPKNKLKFANINGFNCSNYNKQPTVLMTVRMPTENICVESLDEIDLLNIIKKNPKEKRQRME